jgi:hypothetical protein
MPGILQEKFQVDNPQQRNDDAQAGWITDKEARAKKGTPGREGREGGDAASQRMNNAVLYARLPPGMDLEDQEMADIRQMPIGMGGTSDVSRDWNREAVRTGFKRLPMRATDDEYSNAHVDAFYDEMDVDGNVGFAERNNVLDRM